ncbi:MAG: hypothetical protein IPN32_05780 [Deltaproteobacteria bacterium]|nr:hypothetical protein [Deltaproteobacteria bacterium]
MRRSFAIASACAVGFVLAHPPMWWADAEGVRRYPSWDLMRVFWGDLVHMRRALAEGSLPWWCAWDRVGYPFVAEPQTGMFDVTTWCVVAVGLLLGAMPAWLAVLKVVLHYAIAGSGMAALLRERRLPGWAIAFGTTAFVLAPRLDKLKDQSALWPTAWAGWLLLAIDRVVAAPSRRGGLWLGAAGAVVICAGYPPAVFRLVLVAVPWLVVGVVTRLRDPTIDRRAYLRGLGLALAIAAAVTMVLSAGQIAATLSVLPDTTRAGLGAEDVVASRTIPAHAWGLFAPLDSATALLTYAGVATAAGVVTAVVLIRDAQALVLAAVGALGFVLACGEHLPLLPALAQVPGFASFRIAGHYLLLPSLEVSVLAPRGLAALTTGGRRGAVAGVVVAVVGAAVFLWRASSPSIAMVLLAMLSLAAVAALGLVPPRLRSPLGWLVAMSLALDLFVAGRPVADILAPMPDPERPAPMLAALDERGGTAIYRFADFGFGRNRVGPRFAARDLVGHRPALTDPRYLLVYRAALDANQLLAPFNVAVVGRETQPTRNDALRRDLRPTGGVPLLYEVREPWPRAFLTTELHTAAGVREALTWLRARASPAAVIEDDDAPELALPASSAAPLVAHVRLEHERTNALRFVVETEREAVMVIAEAWAPHWRASIDGVPTPVFRANLLQRALVVPARPGAAADARPRQDPHHRRRAGGESLDRERGAAMALRPTGQRCCAAHRQR